MILLDRACWYAEVRTPEVCECCSYERLFAACSALVRVKLALLDVQDCKRPAVCNS